jgi:hypothetical protein
MYPSQAALRVHKRPLGEILVRAGFISEAQLAEALASKPPGLRIGEHLVNLGLLRETQLYQALGMQQNVPFEKLDGGRIPVWIARALPGAFSRKWHILPFRIAEGRMYVAGPELPGDEMRRQLQMFTRLEMRFQYITPGNFDELADELLGKAKKAG